MFICFAERVVRFWDITKLVWLPHTKVYVSLLSFLIKYSNEPGILLKILSQIKIKIQNKIKLKICPSHKIDFKQYIES